MANSPGLRSKKESITEDKPVIMSSLKKGNTLFERKDKEWNKVESEEGSDS